MHNNEQSMKSVKCKYCGQKDGVHKMGCETRKITIMADITKCTNLECPLKEHCYRWTAKTNEHYQSVQKYEFTIDDDGKVNCEDLMENFARF